MIVANFVVWVGILNAQERINATGQHWIAALIHRNIQIGDSIDHPKRFIDAGALCGTQMRKPMAPTSKQLLIPFIRIHAGPDPRRKLWGSVYFFVPAVRWPQDAQVCLQGRGGFCWFFPALPVAPSCQIPWRAHHHKTTSEGTNVFGNRLHVLLLQACVKFAQDWQKSSVQTNNLWQKGTQVFTLTPKVLGSHEYEWSTAVSVSVCVPQLMDLASWKVLRRQRQLTLTFCSHHEESGEE